VQQLAIVDVVIPGCGGDFSQGGGVGTTSSTSRPTCRRLVQGRERLYLALVLPDLRLFPRRDR
jgi:hypothetical protein